MLTIVHGDLLARADDGRLTADEARERDLRREALVRLLCEIAAPSDEDGQGRHPVSA